MFAFFYAELPRTDPLVISAFNIQASTVPRLIFVVFGFWFSLLSQPVLANSSPAVASAANTLIDLHDVAFHPEWLALLHVKKVHANEADLKTPVTGNAGGSKKKYQSYVDDERFFLGGLPFHPKSELDATLEGFKSEPKLQCRFTGRWHWLQENYPSLLAKIPELPCQKYQEWLSSIAPVRVVLVFAASYLNSPSSMYGHTLLRFDSSQETKNVAYLSAALNFAAKVGENENGFLYSIKGLTGGYPGLFSMLPYHEKIKEYSRLENRDLWEYELNLTDIEIQRMLSHAWELEGIEFDYFFFDENCAYRLLELLDIARPGLDLTQGYDWWAIPVDIVRTVQSAGLVRSVSMRPSAQRKLEAKTALMTEAEKSLVVQVVEGDADVGQLLENTDRAGFLSGAAAEYWRYRYASLAREDKDIDKQLELLRIVNRQGQAENLYKEAESAWQKGVNPESGHRTEMLALSGGYLEDEYYTQLEWRLSYHDLLDNGEGYPDNVSLSMGRFQLRLADSGSTYLQRLDVIDITSLPPRDKFFRPVSWKLKTGLERVFENDYPLVSHVTGGGGITTGISRSVSAYVLLNGRIEYSDDLQKHFNTAAGLAAGMLAHTPVGKIGLELGQWQLFNGRERYAAKMSFNWNLSTNHAIRIGWQKAWSGSRDFDDAILGYRFYF